MSTRCAAGDRKVTFWFPAAQLGKLDRLAEARSVSTPQMIEGASM